MDLVVIVILVVIVVAVFKDWRLIIYSLGTLEVFFRLIHHIGDKLNLISINPFVDKYIPDSLYNVLAKYTDGIIYDILSWCLIIVFIMFLVYLVKYIIRRA